MTTKQTSQEMLDAVTNRKSTVEPIVLTNFMGSDGPTDRQLQAADRRLNRNKVSAVRAFDKVDHDDPTVEAFAAYFSDSLATREEVDALLEVIEASQKETAAANRKIAQLESQLATANPFKKRALSAEQKNGILATDLDVLTIFIEGEYEVNIETLLLEQFEELQAEEIDAREYARRITNQLNTAARMMSAAKRGK